jgi:hypothetical protein
MINIDSKKEETFSDKYEGNFSEPATIKTDDGKILQVSSLVKQFYEVFNKWLEKYRGRRVCITIETINNKVDETKVESHDVKEESIIIEGKSENEI